MASQQQGTGQHKHKSSEEPYPHHDAPTTTGGKSSGEKSSSSSHQSRSELQSSGSRSTGENKSDMKSREYRGPDGQIHHHTKTYEEQHKGH